AATENLSAGLLDHLMNMHQASGPRMPRIKKLVLSVSAHAVRERPAVSGAIEVELGRRTWPGAKGEAFTPPFLCRRLPGSILPSRARANARAPVWPRRSRRPWAALAEPRDAGAPRRFNPTADHRAPIVAMANAEAADTR